MGLALASAVLVQGCGPARLAVRPVRYDVDVRVDPAAHTLVGLTSVELSRLDPAPADGARATVELRLHPDLVVDTIELSGGVLEDHGVRRGRPAGESEIAPTTHRLVVEDPAETIQVTLGYRGRLYQNVAAGEKDGEVHNLAVSAHVGEEGLYLDPDGYWYPRVETAKGADPALALAEYRLTADPVPLFDLVAGLESEPDAGDGRLRWSSPFALDGLVLLGGPLERHSRQHGDVELHAVLAPGKGEVARDILDASAEYLDRYEPLVGPYPFREFTVLEAFFSSGFAFPTCTQIVGSQLSEHQQYRRHGYLDHELLHAWWGNGVFVDPRDGNWCEGLASYLGNYYGHVLDGNEEAARKERRNQSNFLSAIEAEEDLPLATFGRNEGAGRGIGYQKGAAVFHMLERKIGSEALFAGLRTVTSEQMGRAASWYTLQRAFERASGEDLGSFFDQWVRRGGSPLLELVDARWTPGSEWVAVTLSQGETSFAIDVPLRLHYGERFEDVEVAVVGRVAEVMVPTKAYGLTAIELDPDYHVFRKLKPEEAMPTSLLTRNASKLLIVLPEGELAEGYRTALESWKRGVLGEEGEPARGHEVVERTAGEVDAEELSRTAVLVLGDAVRHPTVHAFLERTRSPVSWLDPGFAVEGSEHAADGQAILLTVHHPDRAEQGVTVYYGNTPAALTNARVLSFYPNSLLVFETPTGEGEPAGDGGGMPRTQVVRRIDFEFHDRIEF